MEANMEKPAHWAEGLALASAALWPLLLGSMLNRGLITRDEFRELIDGALLSLENLEVDTPLARLPSGASRSTGNPAGSTILRKADRTLSSEGRGAPSCAMYP
jgi:hypothetical protein